jgi:hypothetical protein
MSPITVIPTDLARRAVAARNPRNAGTVDIFHIAGRLGQAHRSAGYVCKTLDAYIALEGFPPPFPIVRAGKLVKTAHKDSTWTKIEVDLWFDNRLPPAARGLVDQAERVAIDSRLSASAMSLFSGNAA